MMDLRTALTNKGSGEVESHIQSGTCVLPRACDRRAKAELAVETALEELFGFTVRTIVRTPAQLDELSSYGVGLQASLEGVVRCYVTFLKTDRDDELITAMNAWGVPGTGARPRP